MPLQVRQRPKLDAKDIRWLVNFDLQVTYPPVAVILLLVTYLGVDEATASNLFYACLTLVLGQGIADSARK